MLATALDYRKTGRPLILALAYAVAAVAATLCGWLLPNGFYTPFSTGSLLLALAPAALVLLRFRLGWYVAIFTSLAFGVSGLGAGLYELDPVVLVQALLHLTAFGIVWSPALEAWLWGDSTQQVSAVARSRTASAHVEP